MNKKVAPLSDQTRNTDEPLTGMIRYLWSISRSICGPGLRESIEYFTSIHDELKIKEIKTGTDLGGGWTVPDEWALHSSFIRVEDGSIYAKSEESNLHVVGFSDSFEGEISWEELKSHLYTIPEMPTAIPYITSYYRRSWGICISYRDFERLSKAKKFYVSIRTRRTSGSMTLADCRLGGISTREIMFTSYLCHPSMANNELSGPIVLSEIIRRVKSISARRYSYRFLLGPETLGAIAYMNLFGDELKTTVAAGFVLSCVGDENGFSHIQTPDGNTLADRLLKAALVGKDNAKTYDYQARGSDERHFASAGLELPFAGFCRSKYGTYSEYHTSLDNLDLVTEKGLTDSVETIFNIIDALEMGAVPRKTCLGEPFLAKYNLYNTEGHQGALQKDVAFRLDLLSFSNGRRSIFDICIRCQIPLKWAIEECISLQGLGLLELDEMPI